MTRQVLNIEVECRTLLSGAQDLSWSERYQIPLIAIITRYYI